MPRASHLWPVKEVSPQFSALALEPRTSQHLRSFVVVASSITAIASCIVFVGGWLEDIPAFRTLAPGFTSMKADTAIATALLAIGLFVQTARARDRLFVWIAVLSALVISLTILSEYAIGWDAGIDQLIVRDRTTALAPGRPSATSAIMIALLSVGILCTQHPRLHRTKAVSSVAACLIAWATLNAYVFGAQTLRELPAFGSVSLQSTAILLVLSAGVLAAEPVSEPVRMLTGRGMSGVICRWLVPPAVLLPPLLGWFLSREGALDLFPAEFDWALYSAISTTGSVWIIMMLVKRIALIDAERFTATELSLHDALTGVANRRAFDAFLLESFNLSRRHGHALSMLLLDIDRFKAYNDSFGHPAGDEVLKRTGALLLGAARASDLVARFGGEEFAVVLPETDSPGARVIAERMRTEVECAVGFRRTVTVSVGVATLDSRMLGPLELLQQCDRALYRAKSAGRNRVTSSDALLEA